MDRRQRLRGSLSGGDARVDAVEMGDLGSFAEGVDEGEPELTSTERGRIDNEQDSTPRSRTDSDDHPATPSSRKTQHTTDIADATTATESRHPDQRPRTTHLDHAAQRHKTQTILPNPFSDPKPASKLPTTIPTTSIAQDRRGADGG